MKLTVFDAIWYTTAAYVCGFTAGQFTEKTGWSIHTLIVAIISVGFTSWQLCYYAKKRETRP